MITLTKSEKASRYDALQAGFDKVVFVIRSMNVMSITRPTAPGPSARIPKAWPTLISRRLRRWKGGWTHEGKENLRRLHPRLRLRRVELRRDGRLP